MKNNNFDNIINKYIKSTQAEATLKGFLYQILVTFYMWLKVHKKESIYAIYPEYKDDICIILKNKKYYIQTKAYDSRNFTLSEVAFISAISNFYMLYHEEKNKKNISFLFYTNGKPGSKKDNLLRKWSFDNLQHSDKNLIYKKIEIDLLKSLSRKLKIDDKEFIDGVVYNWNNFIDSIKLQFNYKRVDEDIDSLKKYILDDINKLNYCIDKNVIYYRLLIEIIEKSINKNKDDKEINKKLLNNILNNSEENIIMDLENKLTDMKNYIKHEIDSSKDEIIKEIRDTKKLEEKNIKTIVIRSREKIGNKLFQLDLSKFFMESKGDNYRKIKNKYYWNNEIIDNIENFFCNVKKDINGEEVYLDLINTHTSIAFFIGYMYLKQFSDIMYFKKGNKIYIPKNNYNINQTWSRDKDNINKGNEINIIITTTINPKDIKNAVKNFTIDNSMKVDSLITYYLKNGSNIITSKASITEENILRLVREVSDNILEEFVNKKINLFLSCPNEFAYLLGREFDRFTNFNLYEIEEYRKGNYIRTLDFNYINNKY